jgi:hypothetical protein
MGNDKMPAKNVGEYEKFLLRFVENEGTLVT